MKNCLIEELKRYDRWVCWKAAPGKDGRITKVPYEAIPAGARWAKSNDPKTWKPYETAASVANTAGFNGVGFVLGADLPYTCIDLDHCVNRETGEMKEPAATIVTMIREAGGTYIEHSPSNTGLHIWLRGELPADKKGGIKRSEIGVELYQAGRYITITGEPLDNVPIADMQSVLDEIINTYGGLKEKQPGPAAPSTHEIVTRKKQKNQASTPAAFDDDFLYERMLSSGDTDLITLLTVGDFRIKPYPSHSEAVYKVLSSLAWWTNGNTSQMKRLFLRAAIYQTYDGDKHNIEKNLNTSVNNMISDWEAGGRKHYDPKNGITLPASNNTQPGSQEESPAGELPLHLEDWTDEAQAKRIVTHYGNVLKYCDKWHSWTRFNGMQWELISQEQAYIFANKMTDRIAKAILHEKRTIENALFNLTQGRTTEDIDKSELAEKQKQIKLLDKAYSKTISSKNTPAIEKVMKQVKGLTTCEPEDFDRIPYILNCTNGTLDLTTGILYPHKPEQMLMKNTKVAYMGKYHSSLWLDTIAAILPDPATREYLQKAFGSALAGEPVEDQFFYLQGRAGNGKTTVLNAVKAAFGTYAESIPQDVITTTKRAFKESGNQATPYIAELRGCRIAISNEVEKGYYLKMSLVKSLSGGNEIKARQLYSKAIDIKPTYTLFFDANDDPPLQDGTSEAIKRRLRKIVFPVHFTDTAGNKDRNRKKAFAKGEPLEDVLTWLVEGYQKYKKDGLETPPAVKEATEKYFYEMDNVQKFIDACCVVGQGRRIARAAFGTHFRDYCIFNDYDPGSKQAAYETVENKLLEHFGNSHKVYKRNNGIIYFNGISLKNVPIQ